MERKGRGGKGRGGNVQFHHLLLSNLTTESRNTAAAENSSPKTTLANYAVENFTKTQKNTLFWIETSISVSEFCKYKMLMFQVLLEVSAKDQDVVQVNLH